MAQPAPPYDRPIFQRFQRNRGEAAMRTQPRSAAILAQQKASDLDIILAPLDGYFPGFVEEYTALVKTYGIPNEFVAERVRGVTHGFGSQIGPENSEILWMHFLAVIPGTCQNRQPEWLKSGVVLYRKPSRPTHDNQDAGKTYRVLLIVFQPCTHMLQRLAKFVQSSAWETAVSDPYVLVDIALLSWYERIDEVAWTITDLARTAEEDIFCRARNMRKEQTSIVDLDLAHVHTIAKSAVYMIEGLDAAIRLVDSAMFSHDACPRVNKALWQNTHRLLRYRQELLHSSRLRTVSSWERIKNTIDLAFHIGAVHDSRLGLRDSRSMRIISVVGTVFIPFSAISTVFGTQFFTSMGQPGQQSADPSAEPHMLVNPDFWILWAIAIPITLTFLAIWIVWEHWPWFHARFRRLNFNRGSRVQGRQEDDESATAINLRVRNTVRHLR